jgi:phage-related protein
VLAAQKEILAQTADAQGDFARTSDSTANTQKRLSAATEDLHVKIGGFLAPAFTAARESALNFINGASGIVDKLGPGFAAFLAGLGPLIQGMFQLAGSVSPVHIILAALQPFIPMLVAAFMQFASVIGGMLPPILAALQPLFGAVVGVVQMLIGALLPLIPIFLQLVQSVVPPFMAILSAVIPVVTMLIQTAIMPLIQFLGSILPPVINALLPVVQIVFNTIAAVITNVMQIIRGIIQVVTGLISGNWSQVWQGIQNITGGVFGAINSLISGALGVIRSIVSSALSAVGSFFSSTWSNVLGGIGGFIGGAVGWFQRLPGMILGALAGAAGWLLGVGRDIIAGLARGISGAAGMIFDAVRGAVGNVVDFAKKILGIGSPSKVMDEEVGQWIPPGVAQGIRRAIPKVASAMGALSNVVRDGVGAANLDLTLSGQGVGGFTRSGSGSAAVLERAAADSKMDELIAAIKGQRPIQVNPSEKMSEQNLARILAEQIMWRK